MWSGSYIWRGQTLKKKNSYKIMIITLKKLWVWLYKFLLKNNSILFEILWLIFKTEDSLSGLPFSTLITAQLTSILSKLEEQSKDENEAWNLCLKDHYSKFTWLLLFKNHFFNPQTGSIISQGFRWQISGLPSFASMRWKQPLCVQVVFTWSEHARRVSSAPWWQ